MFVKVKYGESKQAVFNPECKIISLLDRIRSKCRLDPWVDIELSDELGNTKDLRENPHRYGNEILNDKETYILLQCESSNGTSHSFLPLLDDANLLSSEFLERLASRTSSAEGRKGVRKDRRNGKSKERKPQATSRQSGPMKS